MFILSRQEASMEQDKKILHAELKMKLLSYVFPTSHTYKEFLVLLEAYLTPAEIEIAKSDTRNAFASLEARGHLTKGDYKVLKELLKEINVPAVNIIEEYEEKFEQLYNSVDLTAETDNASASATSAANDGVDSSVNPPLYVLFDVVASALPRNSLDLGVEIDLTKNEIDTIQEENTGLPQEQNFQILRKWYGKDITRNHVEVLKDVLSKIGRSDVVVKLSEFKMVDFDYQCRFEGNKIVTERDGRIIAGAISRETYKMLRFLNLEQSEIDQIRMDYFNNQKEQVMQMFYAWKNKVYPNCTRNKLCSGLKYVERDDVIKLLEDEWSKSPN